MFLRVDISSYSRHFSRRQLFCYNMTSVILTHALRISHQVAILDGITMGGGAGVSIPGTFRVATDRTVCHRKHNVSITFQTSWLLLFLGNFHSVTH